jgi:hypothetical protein
VDMHGRNQENSASRRGYEHFMKINIIELNQYAPLPFVFSEAALCLRDSIRLAGYSCELLIDSVDIADANDYSIVLGAKPGEPRLSKLNPSRIILFNFEQLNSNSALVDEPYINWLQQNIVFDYHSDNVEFLKTINPNGCFHEIPMVPAFSLIPELQSYPAQTSDVLFVGSKSKRRLEIIDKLNSIGIHAKSIQGAYGTALTSAILGTKIILNVHFYETKLFPALRVLQPVLLGIPVVSETSVFSANSDWSRSGIKFVDYSDIVVACSDLLNSTSEQLQNVKQSLHFISTLEFTKLFRAALGAVDSHQ